MLQTSSIAAIAHLGEMVGPERLARDRATAPANARSPTSCYVGKASAGPATTRLRPSNTGDCGYRLDVERNEVLKIRSSGTVDHDIVEEVLGSFDIEESMLTVATERTDRLAEEEPVATPLPAGPCGHLGERSSQRQAEWPKEDCIREGTRTVHLRICLTCGNGVLRTLGCSSCSSRHHTLTRHPVMRSFEPGESWRWCFIDERIG